MPISIRNGPTTVWFRCHEYNNCKGHYSSSRYSKLLLRFGPGGSGKVKKGRGFTALVIINLLLLLFSELSSPDSEPDILSGSY